MSLPNDAIPIPIFRTEVIKIQSADEDISYGFIAVSDSKLGLDGDFEVISPSSVSDIMAEPRKNH